MSRDSAAATPISMMCAVTSVTRAVSRGAVGATIGELVSRDVCRVGFCCQKDASHLKVILNFVNGQVEPGDCVAIIGASGAGKSSLLKILGGRDSDFRGGVYLNGTVSQCSELEREMVFITQEEDFFGELTVREHLNYQAALRLPINKEARDSRVKDVVETFQLVKCLDSRIGNPARGKGRGISGGERKRLNVATELLTNPGLILADEPTSGLDAYMAYVVVRKLRQLADKGATVISTIHQPSVDVFNQFTKVMVLAEGNITYFGPREALVSYFASLGLVCPPYTNTADFVLERFTVNWSEREAGLAIIENYARFWKLCAGRFLEAWTGGDLSSNQIHEEAVDFDDGGDIGKLVAFDIPVNEDGAKINVGSGSKASTLLRRLVKVSSRNPAQTFGRTMQFVTLSIIIGIVFFQLDAEDWRSRAGACFALLMNCGMQSLFMPVFSIEEDRALITKEKQAGVIHAWVYLLAKMGAGIVFHWYNPLIYTTISFWMMGLAPDAVSWLIVSFSVLLFVFVVEGLGYVIGTLFKDINVSAMVAPLFVLPLTLTSGFIFNLSSLSDQWLFLANISPFRLCFSVLLHTVFTGAGDFTIPPTECDGAMPICNGQSVLEFYEVDGDKPWLFIVYLLIEFFALRIISALIFAYRQRNKH
ncbi:MAG: uncharacterized protein KVP18_000649 [Porospora cf. gigantea A]|uniref:uncharacterized protein n=1 Tax=Porospora cf. gigantea A TaxID=2853593 RepID=UPI00355A5433|nr:MAG: hypothetical protein KVP18_000649 [Porospora cf. gigantea A]